jgi:predicted ATPase
MPIHSKGYPPLLMRVGINTGEVVLQEQRKALHERTGQALETVYAATLHEHYSDLAHHYRRSANTEKAIHYLQLAGQQAVQRSANPEAITHLTAALDLLLMQPKTRERAAQEPRYTWQSDRR